MSRYALIELGNELAHATAEVRHHSHASQEAIRNEHTCKQLLEKEMVRQGVSRFDLDGYREVVWLIDTDEIVIVEKDSKKNK